MRLLSRAALASFVLGCTPSPETPTTAPSSTPTAPASASGLSVFVDVATFSRDESFVGTVAGADAYIAGGDRFTLRGAVVTWAEERIAGGILAAAEVEGGWVIVGRDGVTMKTKDFLGALERFGNLPEPAILALPARKSIVVVGASGALYSTAGQGPIVRRALPSGVMVLSGAFADPRHGAVVANGGALFATSDGGDTWRAVPLPGKEAAWRVDLAEAPNESRLVVTSTAGMHTLESDGSLAELKAGVSIETGASWLPHGAAKRSDQGRPLSEEQELHVEMTRWKMFPASKSLSPLHPAVIADVAYVPTFDGLIAFDLKAGVEKLPAPKIDTPDDRVCGAFPWAAGLAVVCDDETQPSRVLFSPTADELKVIPNLSPPGSASYSDDGRHVAWIGGCSAATAEAYDKLCTFEVGKDSAPREIPLDLDVYDLAGVRGARALLGGEDASTASAFRIVDLDSKEITKLKLSEPALEIDLLTWVKGGGIVGVARSKDQKRSLVWANPNETTLRVGTLPAGARSVGFVDPKRGIAAGTTLAELWGTADGGASWEALTGVSGSGAGVAIMHRQDPPEHVHCDDAADAASSARCVVGNVVVSWGPVGSSKVYANEVVTKPASVWLGDDCRDEGGVDGRGILAPCHEDQPAVSSCSLVLGDPKPSGVKRAQPRVSKDESVRLVPIGLGDRRAVLEEWSGAANKPPRLGISWLNGKKRLQAAPSPTVPARTRLKGYSFVLSDAKQVLFTQCEGSIGRRSCSLLRAEAGGQIEPLLEIDDYIAPSNTFSSASAMSLADGRALVLIAQSPAGIPDGVVLPAIDLLVMVGKDGKVQGRRAFAWLARPGRRSGLGSVNGEVGYVTSSATDPNKLELYALQKSLDATASPLATISTLRVVPCDGAAASSDQLRLYAPAHVLGVELADPAQWDSGESMPFGLATFQLGAGKACVRSFESFASTSGTTLSLQAGEGTWTGHAADLTDVREAACDGGSEAD